MYESVQFYRQIETLSQVSAPSLDAATLAWISAVITNGGAVSAARGKLVDTLILGLKADSIFTKFDRLWLFAAENAGSALTDLIVPALATAVNSPAFVANRGYTGVDASSTVYIDTGFDPNTGTPNFTLTAGHMSVWSNTDAASGASGGQILDRVSTGDTNVLPRYSDGKAYFRIDDTVTSGGTTNASSLGHFIDHRDTNTTSQGYINGALFSSPNSHSAASLGGVGKTFSVLGGGATDAFGSGLQATMASFGGSLSGTDVTNFYNRLRTYMTAVGVS